MKVEAIFSFQQSLYFESVEQYFFADLEIDSTTQKTKIKNPKIIRNKALNELLLKDKLLSSNRVGELSDNTFTLLFENKGLVVADLHELFVESLPNTS